MFDSVKVKAGITQVTRLSAWGNSASVLAVGNLPAGNPWAGILPAGNPPAGALPVLPALSELLPGGLARGSVVAAGRWSLLCLALAAGASVYDLRGISDTLAVDDHLFGLIQFKLGTGGEAVEYLGERYPVTVAVAGATPLFDPAGSRVRS